MSVLIKPKRHSRPGGNPEWVPLEQICEIIQGQSPPGSTYNFDGIGLPFFQGKAEFSELYPTPAKWCTEPTKIAYKNDVLISIRAPVGPTNFCPMEACIGRGLAALRPRNGMSSKYLLYAMRSTVASLADKATGTTFAAVSGKQLRAHLVPFVPPSKQESIVAELETQLTRLDASVTALKRVQANLKRYRASVLKAACEGRLVPTEAELAQREGRSFESGVELLASILEQRKKVEGKSEKQNQHEQPSALELPQLPNGWVWSSLGQCFTVGVGATPSRKESDYWNGDIPWVSSGEVQFSRITETHEHITTAGLANSSTKLNPPGSVLLAMIGQGKTRGQAALLEIEAANNQNCAAIWVANTPIPSKYVYYWLMGRYEETRTRGSGNNQQALNKSLVEKIPLPLPPLAELIRIVAELERRLSVIEELEATVAANLKRAERLRQALLARSFLPT